VSTVSDQPTRRAPLPTNRGRRAPTAIGAAARYGADIGSVADSLIPEVVRLAQADRACIGNLANTCYRPRYDKEGR
jgi:hypothetical protein